jgi:hypothetical protein
VYTAKDIAIFKGSTGTTPIVSLGFHKGKAKHGDFRVIAFVCLSKLVCTDQEFEYQSFGMISCSPAATISI